MIRAPMSSGLRSPSGRGLAARARPRCRARTPGALPGVQRPAAAAADAGEARRAVLGDGGRARGQLRRGRAGSGSSWCATASGNWIDSDGHEVERRPPGLRAAPAVGREEAAGARAAGELADRQMPPRSCRRRAPERPSRRTRAARAAMARPAGPRYSARTRSDPRRRGTAARTFRCVDSKRARAPVRPLARRALTTTRPDVAPRTTPPRAARMTAAHADADPRPACRRTPAAVGTGGARRGGRRERGHGRGRSGGSSGGRASRRVGRVQAITEQHGSRCRPEAQRLMALAADSRRFALASRRCGGARPAR